MPADETLLGTRALVTLHRDGTLNADFAVTPSPETAMTILTSGQGEWVVHGEELGVAPVVLVNDKDQRFGGTVTIDGIARLDANGAILVGAFDFTVISAAGAERARGSGTPRGDYVPLEP